MKDDIKESVNKSFNSAARLYDYKHQERKRLRNEINKQGDGK